MLDWTKVQLNLRKEVLKERNRKNASDLHKRPFLLRAYGENFTLVTNDVSKCYLIPNTCFREDLLSDLFNGDVSEEENERMLKVTQVQKKLWKLVYICKFQDTSTEVKRKETLVLFKGVNEDGVFYIAFYEKRIKDLDWDYVFAENSISPAFFGLGNEDAPCEAIQAPVRDGSGFYWQQIAEEFYKIKKIQKYVKIKF